MYAHGLAISLSRATRRYFTVFSGRSRLTVSHVWDVGGLKGRASAPRGALRAEHGPLGH